MPHPTNPPDRLGSPCWDIDLPDQFISTVARVDASYADSFFASHSPFETIDSNKGDQTEAGVYEQLFNSKSPERLFVVTGEPGCGKSHFINWLKLRLDDALARGEKEKIKSVMIKRRSGSLRDALEQLIEQLPDFHAYLDPIKSAIIKLSGESANRELCFKLSQLLHSEPLPDRRLRELHNLFSDPGSLRWLCRDGGVVDRNVQRLISQSELDERETLPLFDEKDFRIEDAALCRQVGQSVQDLLDVFDADEGRRETALSHANKFMRAALEGLTGLGNQTLYQIFRSIRQELKQQGYSLALFIEDVSTLSALDTEVVNVLEPQNDPSLCQLYGVIGMTTQALDRLPENMQQRIDLRLMIRGSKEHGPLVVDPDYADRFIARYLNAMRLSKQDIKRVAQYRREGFDVRLSACEECRIHEECFKTFGKVDIEDQKIGLFPFMRGTAHRLLRGLPTRGRFNQNPRGLLMDIVTPILKSVSTGIERGPVNMGLTVDPKPPTDLSDATGRYLGGWDDKSKQRLSYLVWYWVGTDTLAKAVGNIAALADALRLPKLSQTPSSPIPPTPPGGEHPKKLGPQPASPQPQLSEYQKYLGLLEKWAINNESLHQDATFRELLLPMIKRSIPWDDLRRPAAPACNRVVQMDTKSIKIEEMVSRPQFTSLHFQFPRSASTNTLLRVSLAFRYLGDRTWKYSESDAVSDRREYGKWIRENVKKFIQVPEPENLDPEVAYASAIRFLIVAYQFTQKKPLPIEYSDAVNDLFSFEPTIPTTLTPELGKIAQDLPARVQKIREFLSSELDVPQGTGGTVFIDPLPIIRAIESYKDECSVDAVNKRFDESFWAPRFKEVTALGRTSWARLEETLRKEASELGATYKSIKRELTGWDLMANSVQDQLEEFVLGCKNVRQALIDGNQSVGNKPVEAILARPPESIVMWKQILSEAERNAETGDPVDTLRFEAKEFIDLSDSLATLVKWAGELDKLIVDKYKKGTGGGDLDEEIRSAHRALDAFSTLAETIGETPDVEA